jgi:putative transcriptional regulator
MPLTEQELLERDAKRDIGTELLEAVRQMNAGEHGAAHQVQLSEVARARQKAGFSQARFANLLGVSVRTLQQWEQGRRQPSGAARSLLKITLSYPQIMREAFGGEVRP